MVSIGLLPRAPYSYPPAPVIDDINTGKTKISLLFPDGGQLKFNLFGIPIIICINETDIVTVCQVHPPVPAKTYAQVILVTKDLHPLIPLIFPDNLQRIILRGIINNEELHIPVGLPQNRINALFQVTGIIIIRQYYTHQAVCISR
jgi:hypothetical protein